MLNNDFNVLVQKYEQYKKQKSKKRNRRILLLLMVGALTYYISTLNFAQPTNGVTQDKNTSVEKIEETQTISTQELIDKTPPQEEIKKEVVPKKIEKKVSKPKKSGLKVTTKENSLEQLLENQEQSKSYSSTIALANFHYSKKEYQEAIKWSIDASKKNKSKVRPWIVYAKSKKALGKEDVAKKALTLFLKKHHSQEAKELLNSL